MPTPIMADIDVAPAQGYTQRGNSPRESPRCERPLASLPNPLDVHAANTSICYKLIKCDYCLNKLYVLYCLGK